MSRVLLGLYLEQFAITSRLFANANQPDNIPCAPHSVNLGRPLKTLLIMRHGKAQGYLAAHLNDFQRSLTTQGLDDTHRMGLALSRAGVIPELILVSEAKRATTTAEQVASALGLVDKVVPNPRLYGASAQIYLEEVQQLPGEISIALVVGHNPGITRFAHALRSTGSPTRVFPPGAVACHEFAVQSWDEVHFHQGNCRWFIKPSEVDR